MADAMWMKIRDVKWKEFKTSHGDGSCMPTILKSLSSRKPARAMRASHQLWTALCSGGSVYSAVVPAIPLLLEIFTISDPAVKEGIIDVLVRCNTVEVSEDWAEDLEFLVVQAKENLRFLRVKDEMVRDKIIDFSTEKEK